MLNYVKKEIISVLWTGGWDSTYRIIELSRRGGVKIQPVYILDENRNSHNLELNAIDKITKMLEKRKETLAEFLSIDIIKVSEIPESREVTEAWRVLNKEFNFGIQHDWTARIANWKYPMINMCIEKVLEGYRPTAESIAKHGAVKKTQDGYVIDREKSDNVLNLVLGNICLPIFDITEPQMLENLSKWGYMDVMENIWFCHRPINEKPCGLCSPCHTKMNSHMEFLLPQESQRRCRRLNSIENKFGKFAASIYSRAARKIKFI